VKILGQFDCRFRVVENKIKWVFTELQIPSYHEELHNGPQFSAFSNKILTLLSPTGRAPKKYPYVIPLQWSAVQKELARAAAPDHARQWDPLCESSS
jgi:hypothetical protein